MISPLLSRTKVYVLDAHTAPQLVELLKRAIADSDRGLGQQKIEAAEAVLFRIASFANGDARAAYNTLELCVRSAKPAADGTIVITSDLLEDVLQRKLLRYDKSGEEHFNLISALHKSVRNSDPDAALYWLARMLESGEDPLYLARRMVRMASEPSRSPRKRPSIFWARRKATSRWPKPACIYRSRQNPMPSTPPMAQCKKTFRKPKPIPFPCICATRSPA